ncbi:MAG: excinuclease ABC subunit B [Verrucomicrobia bacterium]|nr:MAG: excinuclease ABC subunit B [Verrucomicrobiota bacterium]
MKCDFCSENATVFLTQLVEGVVKKVCLCEACAQERGVTDPTGFSLADLLLGGTNFQAMQPGNQPSKKNSVKACPTCGFTIESLKQIRRFGCGDCYQIFGTEVTQMLRGMHQGTTHQGKAPAGQVARQYRQQRIDDLSRKLETAIAEESYEEAAAIRDQMRELDQTATH